MNKEQVKEYIQKYNSSHSKEAIKKQLQNSGAREKDIEEAFKEITPNPPQNTAKKGNSGLALGLVIGGLFIPLIGWIMIIIGLVFGFKARGINKNDVLALVAIIIGCVTLLLNLLIIGALIFSFVDFGAVLPTKLDLNNNLIGSANEIFACSDSCSDGRQNSVYIALKYIGVKTISINSNAGIINTIYGNVCKSVSINNLATEIQSEAGEEIQFRNGQTGFMVFQCEKQLIKNDMLEGDIKITLKDMKTQQKIDSTGSIRLNIN